MRFVSFVAAAVVGPALAAGACGGPQKPELGTPSSAAPPPTRAPQEKPERRPDPILSEEPSRCPEGMAELPAGTLWLGSPKGKGREDEHPQTQVEMPVLCLDETEVTVGEYRACVANGICEGPPKTVELGRKLGEKEQARLDALCTGGKDDDLPLNCVSYDDAAKLCGWKGRRLPTEQELEYAAIGGEDQLVYPWGNLEPTANNVCWRRKDGPCKTKSVPPAAFDLYDIAGNLSEWTSTPYGRYPSPPASGDEHVVRGASWKTTKPEDMAGKRRFRRPLLHRDVDLGFRCAKTP